MTVGLDFFEELKSREMSYGEFEYSDIQEIKKINSLQELSKFLIKLGYNGANSSNLSDLADVVIFTDNHKSVKVQRISAIFFIILGIISMNIFLLLLGLFFCHLWFFDIPKYNKSLIKNQSLFKILDKNRKKFSLL